MSGTATRAGPVETTYATAEPGRTSVAAAGTELMTLPATIVAWEAWLRVPATSPALVIVESASISGRSTMSGTATLAGPVETTYATAESGRTSVAAVGIELMTLPATIVGWEATVRVPATSPASSMAAIASASGTSTMSGTATDAGATAT